MDKRGPLKDIPEDKKFYVFLVDPSDYVYKSLAKIDWNEKGTCAFTLKSTEEPNRFPRYINEAELKNKNAATRCYEVTHDFDVLQKKPNSDVEYTMEKQVKIVAYREIHLDANTIHLKSKQAVSGSQSF